MRVNPNHQKRSLRRLRQDASELKRNDGISHTQALQVIAMTNGYDSWNELKASLNSDSKGKGADHE